MGTTRTRRLVHLDEDRQAALNGVGRTEHDTYLVTEDHDGTLVLTPMPGWTDEQLALLERPEVQDRLKPGGESVIEVPVDPDRDTAALRLACLALRQAGLWGEANFAVEVAHPRFAEAVEAAAAAGDEQQALEAASRILEGPEAAEVFGLTP